MRYAALAALLLCGGLSAALWWQTAKVDNLKTRNALLDRNAVVLHAQVKQAKLSSEVSAARAVREQRMNGLAQDQIESLREIKLGEVHEEEE